MEYIALFAVGIMTGTVSALLGIGGGILMVPVLTLLFHLPLRMAVGTSLVGIIATSAGVAVAAPKNHNGDIGLALKLEVGTAAGAIAGSLLAGIINEKTIYFFFACVTFFTAGYILIKAWRKAHTLDRSPERLFPSEYHPIHWIPGISLAGLAGALSGLLGVSGGFIKVPLMYSIMDVPLGIASATSSIMVGITAAASVFIYQIRGDIHPLVVVPVAVGVFIGAILGFRLLPRTKVAWLQTAMVAVLTIFGIQMLVKMVIV